MYINYHYLILKVKVYPRLPGTGGVRYLATPRLFKMLFMGMERDRNEATLPADIDPPPEYTIAEPDSPTRRAQEEEANEWKDLTANDDSLNKLDSKEKLISQEGSASTSFVDKKVAEPLASTLRQRQANTTDADEE